MVNDKIVALCLLLFTIELRLARSQEECLPINLPKNADQPTCTNGLKSRSVCSVKCKTGFKQKNDGNSGSLVCWCFNAFACSWQGILPVCSEIVCPSPEHIVSSLRKIDEWSNGFGALIEYDGVPSDATEEWSLVVAFNKSLGKNAKVSVSNIKLATVSEDRKTFTLTNTQLNRNFSQFYASRSLLLVNDVEGEIPATVLIGFFKTPINNGSCIKIKEYNRFVDLPPYSELNKFNELSTQTSACAQVTTTNPTTAPTITNTAVGTTQRTTTLKLITTKQPSLTKYKNRYCKLQSHDKSYNSQQLDVHEGHPYFNGNAAVLPTSQLTDWRVLLVFDAVVLEIEVWNCEVTDSSDSGYMWALGPHSWNAILNPTLFDISFMAKQKYQTKTAPKAQIYLCSNAFIKGDSISTGPSNDNSNKLETKQIVTFPSIGNATVKTSSKPRRRRFRQRTKKPAAATTTAPTADRCDKSSPMGTVVQNPQQTKPNPKPNNDGTKYNYNELLHLSILFYEAQRSGFQPARYKRIKWRGNAGLKDGCQIGVDLSKGWFDAADHVKFNFPMSFSVTLLSWGGIIFRDAYKDAGELTRLIGSIKWPVDYLMACHISKYELVGQVGHPRLDHMYWGRPEQMKMKRPIYKITQDSPGSDLAGETAAALAASSMFFKPTNQKLSIEALRHAKELFDFADRFRGKYDDSIREVVGFYDSVSGFEDELLWSAAWLYKATREKAYLNKARTFYNKIKAQYTTAPIFSWDHKLVGAQVLLANLTGESEFRNPVALFLDNMLIMRKTPQGLLFFSEWAPNRYAANVALIALAACTLQPPLPRQSLYFALAEKQIHLLLGDTGRSYVVGFGKNFPTKIHHRASSCGPYPEACNKNMALNNPNPNPFILYGALVGGPDKQGIYSDQRKNFKQTETACDFNAGFQSAVAGLKHFALKKKKEN